MVIVLAGAPGAGKSTYAEGYEHVVSSDALREYVYGNRNVQNPAIWGVVKSVLRAKIEEYDVVVLDATMAKRRDRVGMVNYIRGIIAPGRKVVCVHFDVDKNVLIERAKHREVPRAAIDAMYSALKANPPCVEDGFDEVYTHNGYTRQ